MTTTKIQLLKKRVKSWEKEVEKNLGVSGYELMLKIAEYKLETAEGLNHKRLIRKNFRKLQKLQNQIKELREETCELFKTNDYKMEMAVKEVTSELEEKYGYYSYRKILYGGDN